MKKRQIKCILFLEILLLLVVLIAGSSLNALNVSIKNDLNKKNIISNNAYIDISPEEAWNMLNDPSPENGIQIPIDVRSETEWRDERINTPFPEHPLHFGITNLQTGPGLEEFISLYNNSEIIVYCRSGTRSASASYIIDNSNFSGVIYNMLGGINDWKTSGYPVKRENNPPNKPETPSGSILGNTDEELTFSTKTDDQNDDPVRYGWDWNGDDIIDELTEYYLPDTEIEKINIYKTGGLYNIKVAAIDNVGDISEFSENFTVVINSKPNPPIIDGPLNGKAGKEYTYSFTVTDPEENNLYLYIEWGDGTVEDWSGPYLSSQEIDFVKTWEEQDTYIIKAKTKDEYDAESDWSSIEVSMPRLKSIQGFSFIQFYKIIIKNNLSYF
jgi:rhodanese-related sulfurtransferase